MPTNDRCSDDIAATYRRADVKLKLYATLFSQFTLEEATVIVDEISAQLHADLDKRVEWLQ
jgi:hypothetical protein